MHADQEELHQEFSGLAGDGVLQFFHFVLHLVQAIDQFFEVLGHAEEERRYFGVFEMLELRNDEVALLSGTNEVYKIFQAGAAQTAMVDALREHPGKEKRIVADMLAHLALVVEGRSGAKDGVGFQQHLPKIAEWASTGIPDFVQSFGLAELSEKVGHIAVDFRTAYAHLAIVALYNFLKKMP